jgi:aspartate/glutamate racemase
VSHRHLGILAHSAEGAALCFRSFCQEGFRELGPNDHPDVTMDCIALAHCMPAWDAGDHAAVRATLSSSVDRLARAGADFFVCPDNTAHIALERGGIDAVVPGPEERAAVNRIIFDELVNGVFTEPSRRAYVRIIDGLAARGCDAVALVCTEIPLLVTPDVSPLPTLDSTRLLARAAFEVAVGHATFPAWRGGPVA